MKEEDFAEKREDDIAPHIFSVSAGMVGVCLTVISLINISSAMKRINTFGDDLTAIDAIVFITSCFLSYFALKTKDAKRRFLLEKTADKVFLFGLALMVAVCFFIVFKFSVKYK